MGQSYPQPLAVNAGSSRTGLAASVVAQAFDSAGVLQATVNSGWAEVPAGSGSYVNFSLVRHVAWGVIAVAASITGQAGFGVVETIPIDPTAAAVLPDIAAGAPNGGIGVTGNTGYVPADVEAVYASANAAQALSNLLSVLGAGGRIDYTTLTPALRQTLGAGYLTVLGNTTPPVAASDWSEYGHFAGSRFYYSPTVNSGQGAYAWTDGSRWYLTSTAPGLPFPAAYWQTPVGLSVTGLYQPQGTAVGVPAVHHGGNAILSGYQSEVPFPTNFEAMGISQVGKVSAVAGPGDVADAAPLLSGVAQGGSSTTIVLQAGSAAPSVGCVVELASGTGAGQYGTVTAVSGSQSGWVVSVSAGAFGGPWAIPPNSTTAYRVRGGPAVVSAAVDASP